MASKTTSSETINFETAQKTLGARIAMARIAKGMTKKSLATKIGIKKATLTAWEDNQRDPRANRLSMLAGILDVSVMWLISGIGNGTSHVQDAIADVSSYSTLREEVREIKETLQSLLNQISALEKNLP